MPRAVPSSAPKGVAREGGPHATVHRGHEVPCGKICESEVFSPPRPGNPRSTVPPGTPMLGADMPRVERHRRRLPGSWFRTTTVQAHRRRPANFHWMVIAGVLAVAVIILLILVF